MDSLPLIYWNAATILADKLFLIVACVDACYEISSTSLVGFLIQVSTERPSCYIHDGKYVVVCYFLHNKLC